ncbi:MAG: hypothetical protein ACKOE4_04105, partial [Candidatus Kapaibacterium sp.]
MRTFLRSTTILAGILLVSAVAAFSQLRVSVNVSSRPDPYLSNWAQRKDIVIVTVINPTASEIQAKFNCQINKDGTYLAKTKPELMPVLTIPVGTTQYFAEDIIPLDAATASDGLVQNTLRTGMLPGGFYEFCVSMIEPTTFVIISQPVCRNFSIRTYQAPILLTPVDKTDVTFGSRPMLRWTPVSPRPDFVVNYRVQVFEVMRGQTPINALRVNRPILDVPNVTTTQLLWPPDFELPRSGQQYIWTVRATDDRGAAMGEPDGYATPFTFNVLQTRNPGLDDGQKRASGGDTTFAKKSAGGGEDTGSGNKTKSAGTGNTGVDSTTIDPNPPGQPCGACSSVVTITDSTAGAQTIAVNDSLAVGNFMMKVTQVTNASAASTAGKGEIVIPWLLARVQVVFENLVINAAGRVVSGQVNGEVAATAPQYPQQWAINQVTSWNWVKNSVAAVDQWVKANGQLVKQVNSMNTPLKLPLG